MSAIPRRSGRRDESHKAETDVAIDPRPEDSLFRRAFETAMGHFVAHALDAPADPAVLVHAALFFEGVALLDEAVAFAHACGTAVRAGNEVYVAYLGLQNRPRCHRLSELTIRLLSLGATAGASLQETAAELARSTLLRAFDRPLPAIRSDQKTLLGAFQRGAAAFWGDVLPGPLAADALGLMDVVPCTDCALARRVSQAPLRRDDSIAETGADLASLCASTLGSGLSHGASPIGARIKTIMSMASQPILADLRASQLQLLGALGPEAEIDELAALQLLFAVKLCTDGTIKSDTPGQSATARYTREFVDLTDADPEAAVSLPFLSAEDRAAVYERWFQQGANPVDAHAALHAADMHLAAEFDLEPAIVRHTGWIYRPLAVPRILWDYEMNAIAAAIAEAADSPALKVVAMALFAAACEVPLRPGDVIDAHFEDLEITPLQVVLNLRRRRGRKGQKTSAAEHPHQFRSASAKEALSALAEFREARGALDGEPLWGVDIADSRRVFLAACQLIARLARRVTGDASASFYSLRHTCFSRLLADALMPSAGLDKTRRLKRIAAMGSHRSIVTSAQWYFHLPMPVVRAYADIEIERCLTTDIVARWSGLSVDALHQRASRAHEPVAACWMGALREGVDLARFEDILNRHPCQPDPAPIVRRPIDLVDVLAALQVSERFKRRGDSGCLAHLTAWERSVVSARDALSSQFIGEIRMPQIRQPKFAGVFRQIARPRVSSEGCRAIVEWRERAHGGFLDVGLSGSLETWVNFLLACQVPVSRILIRIDESRAELQQQIELVFATVASAHPAIETVPGGYGRPAAYLLISSQTLQAGRVAPSAATSMVGFHALMLAATILMSADSYKGMQS